MVKIRIGVNFWPNDPNPDADKFHDVEFNFPDHLWLNLPDDGNTVDTSIESKLSELFLAMLMGRRMLR